MIIAPSILSADFARLGQEVSDVLKAGADWVHFDVMDNHYVPNLTIGPSVLSSLRKFGIQAPVDVHLMVKPVDALIEAFATAGADYICFHPEASEHIDRSLALIRSHGCKAGLAFNPATSLEYLTYVADKIDYLLLMSVNPGFGGQAFLPSVLPKIQAARAWCDKQDHEILISVDGGINPSTITDVSKAGANVLVAGSAIFNEPDYTHAIQALKQSINKD